MQQAQNTIPIYISRNIPLSYDSKHCSFYYGMKYHIVWHSQKMQTAGSSKLLVSIRQTTQHHTPDTELHNHSYSNLKPYADVPYLLTDPTM